METAGEDEQGERNEGSPFGDTFKKPRRFQHDFLQIIANN
jgi:hypothetical protein